MNRQNSKESTSQDAYNYYLRLLQEYSSEEMGLIVQLKRFFEWAQGDTDFQEQVNTGEFTPFTIARLKQIGINFNLENLAILWKSPDIVARVLSQFKIHENVDVSEEDRQTISQYPLFALWSRFIRKKNSLHREFLREVAHQPFQIPENPRFNIWRSRRIKAVRSELGYFGYTLDHPILAFELGDGCSVGCWFCAFATRKLTRNFDYAENREMFRQVTRSCVDLFGKNQAGMALLYYGTEPHDNPNYLDFVKDYTEITGSPLCTSTAFPTDTKWMRELIVFYRRHNAQWPRLSVLSKSMLFKIHELYTPEELRDVELLMQIKKGPRCKVSAGRILEEQSGLRNREEGHYLDDIVPQGSIACVTGFLTNMVRRTVQLVSPCYTCQKWPYSYRIFDEVSFSNADSFRTAIETLIERNMPGSPPGDMPMQFRDDLDFRLTDNGFDLVSPNQVHHFQNKNLHGPLGRLIAEGVHSYDDLFDIIMDKHGINPMTAVAAVKKLFDDGFLNEVYIH